MATYTIGGSVVYIFIRKHLKLLAYITGAGPNKYCQTLVLYIGRFLLWFFERGLQAVLLLYRYPFGTPLVRYILVTS
jgi:hypothetical protein